MPTTITRLPGSTVITANEDYRTLTEIILPGNTRHVLFQGFDRYGMLPADCYLEMEGVEGDLMSINAWTVSGERHYDLGIMVGKRRLNAGAPYSIFVASAVPYGRIELFLLEG